MAERGAKTAAGVRVRPPRREASALAPARGSVMVIDVNQDVLGIVRPESITIQPVVVRDRDPHLDEAMRVAAAAMRTRDERADITSAVRAMYRHTGIDPTKTRPSSEALLRRVRKGGELPRINTLVDVINWCSLESQLPFGVYDADQIHGRVRLRLGESGEEYAGIRKDAVHLSGRLALIDDRGPFGNPTSDSARTMVTSATTAALVVIFVPLEVAAVHAREAIESTRERVGRFCV